MKHDDNELPLGNVAMFKIGDRVEYVGEGEGESPGTVYETRFNDQNDLEYGVRWDGWSDHDTNRCRNEEDFGYWYSDVELEKIS